MDERCAQCAFAGTRGRRHYQCPSIPFYDSRVEHKIFVNMLVDAPIQTPFEKWKSERGRERVERLEIIEPKNDLSSKPPTEIGRPDKIDAELSWLIVLQDWELPIMEAHRLREQAAIFIKYAQRKWPDAESEPRSPQPFGKVRRSHSGQDHFPARAMSPKESNSLTNSES